MLLTFYLRLNFAQLDQQQQQQQKQRRERPPHPVSHLLLPLRLLLGGKLSPPPRLRTTCGLATLCVYLAEATCFTAVAGLRLGSRESGSGAQLLVFKNHASFSRDSSSRAPPTMAPDTTAVLGTGRPLNFLKLLFVSR